MMSIVSVRGSVCEVARSKLRLDMGLRERVRAAQYSIQWCMRIFYVRVERSCLGGR